MRDDRFIALLPAAGMDAAAHDRESFRKMGQKKATLEALFLCQFFLAFVGMARADSPICRPYCKRTLTNAGE